MEIPPDLKEFTPGALGSLIALPFLKGSWWVRIAMVLGGAWLSFYGTKPAASYLGMLGAEGLIGFLIGLFGMAVVAKLHELIASVEAAAVGGLIKGWLQSKFGGKS